MIFSVFQQFYEIPKRLEKQFCSRFKIQNAYENDRFQKLCPSLYRTHIVYFCFPHYAINYSQHFININSQGLDQLWTHGSTSIPLSPWAGIISNLEIMTKTTKEILHFFGLISCICKPWLLLWLFSYNMNF